jgi:hypothetical protein
MDGLGSPAATVDSSPPARSQSLAVKKQQLKFLIPLCLFVSSLLAQSGGSPMENWRTYRSEKGNFTVLLPAEAQDTANPAPDGMESHVVTTRQGGVNYLVLYLVTTRENTLDEQSFDEYKKVVFKEFGDCAVQKQGEPTHKLKEYLGHSYRLACNTPQGKAIHTGNLYIGKHYAYTVMAIYPAGSDPLGARRFTDSFSLIDSRK